MLGFVVDESVVVEVPVGADFLPGVVPVAPPEPESEAADESCEFRGLADAVPGCVASANPMPNAIANPPTRPMYRP